MKETDAGTSVCIGCTLSCYSFTFRLFVSLTQLKQAVGSLGTMRNVCAAEGISDTFDLQFIFCYYVVHAYNI